MVNDEWSGAEALENAFRVADEELRKVERERDESLEASALFQRDVHEWRTRAEAAEARTAVTREDVEKAVKGTLDGSNITLPDNLFDAQIDAVWSLVSGSDPAVFVVRESDIEDCQRNEDGNWEFRHSGRVFRDSRDPADRAESLTHHREQVAQRVAIIRAIEAEPADPVTEKARELYALAHPGVFVPKGDDAELAPFLRIAAHVLGQETDHA